MIMRRIQCALIAAVAAIGFASVASVASAADMPVKAPPPVMAPALVWNGFYVGGNVGAGWTRADVSTTNSSGLPGIFGVPANIAAVNAAGTGSLDHGATITGGLQVGYNWQFSPKWLAGVEADINSFSQTQTLTGVAATTIGPLTVTNTLGTKWLATFRGRLGVTSGDWLAYVTGGAALTDQTYTQTFSGTLIPGPAFGSSTVTSTKAGWTAGLGAERMFGAWSVKAEWLYVQFAGLTTNTTIGVPAGNTQLATGTTGHLNENIVRVGLNYHWK
jgi:outer membrane immunogenic protein